MSTHKLQKQFRSVFKVHGVVVVPSSAPYEAVFFKYFDDFEGNLVFVFQFVGFTTLWIRPKPIIGISGVDVDGDTIAMRTLPIGPTNFSPVKRRGFG